MYPTQKKLGGTRPEDLENLNNWLVQKKAYNIGVISNLVVSVYALAFIFPMPLMLGQWVVVDQAPIQSPPEWLEIVFFFSQRY
jgi:hypothetical protein